MNKTEVVATVAARAALTQDEARRCINALLDLTCEEIASGGEVNLAGHMKISAVTRKARTGRNLRTGEPVAVPARKGIKFQPGARLKAAAKQ